MAFMNQCIPTYNKIVCTKTPNEIKDNKIGNSRKWKARIRFLGEVATVRSAFSASRGWLMGPDMRGHSKL